MTILAWIIFVSFIVNIFCVFAMIFIERKKPNSIVAWLIVLTFLPIIGFVFYILIGSGLSYKTRRMLKNKRVYQKEYDDFVQNQKKIFFQRNVDDGRRECLDMMVFNLNNANSAFFEHNSVRVFLNGNDKILSLKKDLENAKHSINLLYYIFANDNVGNEIMSILIQKAKEGVKVKVLFDSVGSMKTRKAFFQPLITAGGKIGEYFPPLFGLRLINLKANYRNHRKIAVIDGKIGYTGGINIRDDHMGNSKKLTPWRDTHIRIAGEAVYSLQVAFFNDWRFCNKINSNINTLIEEGYFPKIQEIGDIGVQIITSGPDLSSQPIKDAFVKMILSAKENVFIHTPYFIPDESTITALKIAKMSGVDVKIIIPSKPDKKFVYHATLSFVKELLPIGIDFYRYNGFMHSKVVIIDNKVVSIGTCNFDNRSFSLNFEINAFLYNNKFAEQNLDYFSLDIQNSQKIEMSFFKRKPWFNKVIQAFYRLFAPLL